MQNCNCGGQTVSIGKCDIDVRACFFFNSTGDMTSKKATFRAFATDVSGGTPGKMVSACCFTNATNAGIVMVERCVLVVCACGMWGWTMGCGVAGCYLLARVSCVRQCARLMRCTVLTTSRRLMLPSLLKAVPTCLSASPDQAIPRVSGYEFGALQYWADDLMKRVSF